MINALQIVPSKSEYWITGLKETKIGKIPVVSTKLNNNEIADNIKARLSNFRNNYKIQPGLYCIGNPNDNSPVLVTANYKLTFDTLRKELNNIHCWIMVLDTDGINVWCAAGKGTFGTSEVIKRINYVNLKEIVNHNTIILPQLGAPGVNAHEVKKETGFKVVYGPVRANDIQSFLRNNMKKDEKMRTVTFNFKERFAIIPLEIVLVALPIMVLALVIVFITCWLSEGNIYFTKIWHDYIPFLSAVIAGGIITPLFLPYIPARSFTVKGLMVGIIAAVIINVAYHPPILSGMANFLLITVTSSLFALMYTGSTPFTSVSGVRREVKVAFPILIPLLIISIIAELVLKLSQ